MAGENFKKDEVLKAPHGADQPTTPHGTPEPSQPTSEFSLTDSSLRRLSERFELLAEVGRGGMGIVYRARDRETGETVALKVLKPEIAARPDLIDRFKTELRLARKITHKNVCRTYDLHRFGDTVVIAMEYVEGESLRAALKRPGGVSLRGGLDWARQVCSALAEAHAQGIVHRDLKPENILIDRQGLVKVMDFGIARSIESDAAATQAGAIVGTPAYMSPEQAEGKPADAHSDIYSLALILYEMFTGRQAFKADTPVALALKQIHETPPPARELEPFLPAFLDRVIEKCLEKNPAKRFQSALGLEAALSEKAEAKPTAVPIEEVELPVHLTRWQRSDWLLVAAAVAGLTLFFPFFNRTSLASRSQVHFDHSVLRRIAEEYAQRLGAPVTGAGRINSAWTAVDEYDYVARTAGAQAALELAGNPISYWLWQVGWHNGTGISVDNRGALQYFSRDFPSGFIDEKLSIEDARPVAEKALRDYLESDASRLQPETAASAIVQGHAANLFKWVDPKGYHGLKRHYEVRLVGRTISFLNSTYEAPVEYDIAYYFRQFLPPLVLALPLTIIGVMQRRQVDSTARWRIVFIGAFVATGEWNNWPKLSDDPAFVVIASLVATVLAFAFMGFCGSVAIERAVRRVAPAKLSSFMQLWDGRKAASQPCGLGVLRGSLIGLALLGLDSFLVWGATSHLPIWLDSFRQILEQRRFLYRSWPTAGVVFWGFWQAAFIAISIAFLSSLAARLVRRRVWLAVLIPAAVTAATLPGIVIDMGAVQPYHWKLALLFLECLGLALCYARFDVLTTFWAVFTFAFCWQNYFLFVIFAPTGAVEQWIAFAVWGLFVLAAAAIAFKSPLRAGYRRLVTAFE